MTTNFVNDNQKTRIIPGITAEYQIVSLPEWAWYWLDDFMRSHKIGYKGIYKRFETQNHKHDITASLCQLAEIHQENIVRQNYSLCNDNKAKTEDIVRLVSKSTQSSKQDMSFPRVFKLFSFMPHATTLDAVWSRLNHRDNL